MTHPLTPMVTRTRAMNEEAPSWRERIAALRYVPQLVRMTVHGTRGDALPPMTMRLMVGAEAGCFENVFQRDCRPRRPVNP